MSKFHNVPSDIEKESLEAHVELCSQRYDAMKDNMERMETRLTNIETLVKKIQDMLAEKENQAYKKLLSVGFALMGSLLTVIGVLGMYILKTLGTH